MRNKNKSELVEFFMQAKTKLFESSETEDEDEDETEDEDEDEDEDEAEDEAEEPVNNMLIGKDRWELPAPPWYLKSVSSGILYHIIN